MGQGGGLGVGYNQHGLYRICGPGPQLNQGKRSLRGVLIYSVC